MAVATSLSCQTLQALVVVLHAVFLQQPSGFLWTSMSAYFNRIEFC